MLNADVLDALKKLRKETCTCRRELTTPYFHDPSCPYLEQGERYLKTGILEDFDEEKPKEEGGTDDVTHSGKMVNKC